jgi:hypothetical protein
VVVSLLWYFLEASSSCSVTVLMVFLLLLLLLLRRPAASCMLPCVLQLLSSWLPGTPGCSTCRHQQQQQKAAAAPFVRHILAGVAAQAAALVLH